jgi:lantibiotic modifying enzyme
LFHGLTGVALFLGWLGELTGDGRHTRLARQAVETARIQLNHDGMARFSGMAGIGGLCYAFAELGVLWSDETLADTAEQHALAAAAYAADDESYDFVSGSAGAIAGLAALHQLRPSAALRDCIRACASRLLATAIRTPAGLGWLAEPVRQSRGARQPIAGFAHGNAGIILALLLAADLLHDQACHDAALRALRYEQALFDHRAGTWAEMGDPALLGVDGKIPERAHWCYGGPGIGLSRLRCLPLTGPDPVALREIDAAVAAVGRVPVFSHCLCHGTLGNAELLLQAAAVQNRPGLRRQAERLALDAAAQIRDTGWKCGMPLNVQTPGLMYGLAGIGYGMLRVASPDRLPAVLTLQPGPRP